MERIEYKNFDLERVLYNKSSLSLYKCKFEGPNDGESPLKECEDIVIDSCLFSLRYGLWHTSGIDIKDTVFDDKTRATFWYSSNIKISHSKLLGVKAIRECSDIYLNCVEINSSEFSWRSSNIEIIDSSLTSEYAFFECSNIKISGLVFNGKYSFQYVNDMVIKDSTLNTKDAFWHSNHVTIQDSNIKSEYLGWYSNNLTLINCKISGTQPFCYCKNLKLINCTMTDCDLAFEYSSVEASIIGSVKSIKNPLSGKIEADDAGEVIIKDNKYPSKAKIILRNKK
ncbi:MAG: DUF3737 family protein [Bacilli bacterium]